MLYTALHSTALRSTPLHHPFLFPLISFTLSLFSSRLSYRSSLLLSASLNYTLCTMHSTPPHFILHFTPFLSTPLSSSSPLIPLPFPYPLSYPLTYRMSFRAYRMKRWRTFSDGVARASVW